MMFLKKAMI